MGRLCTRENRDQRGKHIVSVNSSFGEGEGTRGRRLGLRMGLECHREKAAPCTQERARRSLALPRAVGEGKGELDIFAALQWDCQQ